MTGHWPNSGTPKVSALRVGAPRFARHPWRPELQLKGSPSSADSKPWTRTARLLGLPRPRPLRT
eukprot:2323410-Alexandrium_andersonii.AAC.1